MAELSMLSVARVPAGAFAMGADDGDEDERPAHKVYVDEFFIGAHPVTNAEYAEFVGDTGHPSPAIGRLPLIASGPLEAQFRSIADRHLWANGTPPPGRANHPVTLVRFEDALTYCSWLTGKTGKTIRLPTEAEWERAARGGQEGQRFPWGDNLEPGAAHFVPRGGRKEYFDTAEVGSYPPNAFNLFDMAGNVWEWVSDWYTRHYYSQAQYRNPKGPESGPMRIVRGGSWVNADGRYLRCAYRHKVPPDSYTYSIGFRIAYSPK
jgi:formylglycine-generating enzyme required for sulfatase activity